MIDNRKPDPASTPTGIIFGSTLPVRRAQLTRDEEILQAALLQPATPATPSRWQRVTQSIRRLLR